MSTKKTRWYDHPKNEGIVGFLFMVMISSGMFLLTGLVTSCSKKQDEVNHIVMEDAETVSAGDSITVEWETDSTEVDTTIFYVSPEKFWSSQETKLPKGIVMRFDYAHGGKNKRDNQRDNYVTIKQPNGQLIIMRDVEIDLFLNIEVGDTIK